MVAQIEIAKAADRCIHAALSADLRLIAHVREDERVIDVAVAGGARMLLIRCVARAEVTDHDALCGMLRQGDFNHAILVHCEDDESVPHHPGIDTCSLNELAQVLSRWASEGAAQ